MEGQGRVLHTGEKGAVARAFKCSRNPIQIRIQMKSQSISGEEGRLNSKRRDKEEDMNKEELSQLAYLCMEVERDRQRLWELEEAAMGVTRQITGMPRQIGSGDPVGKYAAQIADLKAVIEQNVRRCWEELVRLNRFIACIADSEMRQILTLRYIGRQSWQQIAEQMNVDGDGSTERKKHDRFLAEWGRKQADAGHRQALLGHRKGTAK